MIWLGPNLQHLCVVNLLDESIDEFLEMVLARNANLKQAGKESVMPFKWISLNGCRLSEKDMKALQEAGVEYDF